MILCLARLTESFGQAQISGVVKTKESSNVNGATISLLNAKDSSVIKSSATTTNGAFLIQTVPGRYLIMISHMEFEKKYYPAFELITGQHFTTGTIILERSSKDLSGITITSQKQAVEVRPDKTILNVQGTINSTGSNALDLLKKSPGVTVDQDDNIAMNGRNAVQVFIDGKASPLSPADLALYLHSLQSAQIDIPFKDALKAEEVVKGMFIVFERKGNA